jgi:hypothetical protein
MARRTWFSHQRPGDLLSAGGWGSEPQLVVGGDKNGKVEGMKGPRLKAVILLSLLAGLLCSCETTDTGMQTQMNTRPEMQPQPPAPLRPAHN